MESYPREIVEAPRPLIFVLSDDDDGADRLVAALGAAAVTAVHAMPPRLGNHARRAGKHSTSADGAEPRYARRGARARTPPRVTPPPPARLRA
jgi:hypothetical protein